MSDVTIQNDLTYLFIKWVGWDYNFWTVIFADIIMLVSVFVISFLVWIAGIYFKWW